MVFFLLTFAHFMAPNASVFLFCLVHVPRPEGVVIVIVVVVIMVVA